MELWYFIQELPLPYNDYDTSTVIILGFCIVSIQAVSILYLHNSPGIVYSMIYIHVCLREFLNCLLLLFLDRVRDRIVSLCHLIHILYMNTCTRPSVQSKRIRIPFGLKCKTTNGNIVITTRHQVCVFACAWYSVPLCALLTRFVLPKMFLWYVLSLHTYALMHNKDDGNHME